MNVNTAIQNKTKQKRLRDVRYALLLYHTINSTGIEEHS